MFTTPPPIFRNAVTEFSTMLLCPKTSLVPLDGRDFKAATLDAELATELEGATLHEVTRGSKDNYIVFWYQPSHLDHMAGIKAELLQTINDMALFCNGHWEPSLIPYALHLSTTNLTDTASGSSSSGARTWRPQFNPPHHSKHQSTSCHSPATMSGSKRHSRPSLRREPVTCSIPDTDLQETVEGKLIPVTGSKETNVATWLNWIFSSFTPPASQSDSSQPGQEGWNGPRLTQSVSKAADTSKECNNLQVWSSQYVAKPVENSRMSVKPDIVLCGQPDPHTSFAWHNVISFLELTSSTHSTQLRRDITCKAYAVFMSQPSRCFVVAISLAHQEFRLHVFDHSGVIYSLAHNLHNATNLFAHLMYTLAFGGPHVLSFDPTFIDPIISPSILFRPRSIATFRMSQIMYIHKDAYTVLCHIYIS